MLPQSCLHPTYDHPAPHFPKSSPVTAGPRLGKWVQEDVPCLHLCGKASGLSTPLLSDVTRWVSYPSSREGRVRAKSEDEN